MDASLARAAGAPPRLRSQSAVPAQHPCRSPFGVGGQHCFCATQPAPFSQARLSVPPVPFAPLAASRQTEVQMAANQTCSLRSRKVNKSAWLGQATGAESRYRCPGRRRLARLTITCVQICCAASFVSCSKLNRRMRKAEKSSLVSLSRLIRRENQSHARYTLVAVAIEHS